jgi:hypothetical protein
VIDYQGSLLDKIKQGIVQLEKAAGKTQTAMQQCDDVTDCMVDVSSLVEVASQLVELMYAMSSDDQQQADYDATLNNLEPAAAALTEADRLWTSSQEIDGDEQASLREAASAQLTTAAERFEAITAPADNNQPPPSQGGCGGAGGLGIVTMLSMLTGLMGLRYSRRCGRRS